MMLKSKIMILESKRPDDVMALMTLMKSGGRKTSSSC
jgi:hypothetical protein